MKRILIIGGSDAGVSAALRAREVYPIVGITMAVADKNPNFRLTGLASYLSGEPPEWGDLSHRGAEEIEKMGIRLLLEHRARHIDLRARTVEFMDKKGRTRMLPYDRLILAAGPARTRPPWPGADLPGVFTLRCMDDVFAMERYLARRQPRSAIIVGSGAMGLEMAGALTRRGLSVTMLVQSREMLDTVDPRLQEIARAELLRNGVRLIDQVDVTGVEEQSRGLLVRSAQDAAFPGDLVLLAAAGRPESELAGATGVPTGIQSAVSVNRAMETGVEGIYAAGECVETWHRLLKKNVYLPLGVTANQGRVAGENAVGGCAEFVGTLGTQAVRIFDIVIARTGLKEGEAREAGFDPITSEVEAGEHRAHLPGTTPLRIRITGDRRTRRVLGAQIVGHYRAEVSKRIDVFATAISAEMSVEEMIGLDLSCSPPSGGIWDPVHAAALEWSRGMQINRAPLPRPDWSSLRDDKAVSAEQPSCSGKAADRLSFAM